VNAGAAARGRGPVDTTRTFRPRTLPLATTLLLAVAGLTIARPGDAQRSHEVPPSLGSLWREPFDIESRDLLYGSGGRDHQPVGPYTFVAEDMDGTKPKFVVQDGRGLKWTIKLGDEARPEVAATRLVWAAGYFVDDDYYVPRVRVAHMPKLRRGERYVARDGTVHGARFERHAGGRKLGDWHWSSNPFVGTTELNRLRVLMALINNWDAGAMNNAVREGPGGVPVYYVSDLGSTFGRGDDSVKGGSRGEPGDYAHSKFIHKVTRADVDFDLRRCSPLMIVIIPYYVRCRAIERIVEDVPRADAQQTGALLGLLSARQIADAFRAAGYTTNDVVLYRTTVQKRIAALRALRP